MTEQLMQIPARTKDVRPHVHVITNNVTINDCANIILAAYGAPTMAQDPREVAEITALSRALVLNLGGPPAQEAMLLAAKKANALGRPVVFDPVGAGASTLRTGISQTLLREIKLAVIRGNASEIRALALGTQTTAGVDVSELDRVTEDNLHEAAAMLRAFSVRTGAVVCLTGAIDLVTDGRRTVALRGGHAQLTRVTGVGCMLTALTGAYCGANPDTPFEAAVAATGAMKLCGEIAYTKTQQMGEGTGMLRTRLMDAVSLLTPALLGERINLEVIEEVS